MKELVILVGVFLALLGATLWLSNEATQTAPEVLKSILFGVDLALAAIIFHCLQCGRKP